MGKMAEKRSRSRVCVDEDRISNLPESVISHILSFLPTKDVVATSVLSTRWKLQWTKLTALHFILCAVRSEELRDLRKFVRFVNYVLLNIDSQSLQKFVLTWWPTPNMEVEYVSIWTNYAINRSVRELVIDLSDPGGFTPVSLHLPGTLFTSGTLQVLKIYAHFVFKVPSVVSLPKLEDLDLQGLLYESDECLPKLLSGCPVLFSLTILRFECEDTNHTMNNIRVISPSLRCLEVFLEHIESPPPGKLEVDAPNLEHLTVHEILEECSVKGLNLVNSVVLDVVLDHSELTGEGISHELYIGRCNSAVKLVEGLNHVKFMTLYPSIIKALSDATTPLSVCFERLIELDVRATCCHWSFLAAILGQSTKLQVLNITIGITCPIDNELCWNDPTKVPECLSSSLLKVSLSGFEGREDEMKMIKYILNHAEVLESFTLESEFSDYKDKYELLQHVATFSRCSRACQLHFD